MLIYAYKEGESKYSTTKHNTENEDPNSEGLKLKSLKSFISILSTTTNLSKKLFYDKIDNFEASYVTIIKHLLRNADSNSLNAFYNASRNNFLILKPLLNYSHHHDVMIRNGARLGLLTMFQKCTDEAVEYINTIVVPIHTRDIIKYLKQTAIDIQFAFDKYNETGLKKACQCFEEEVEYIDDLLDLNDDIGKIIASLLLSNFTLSFVVTPIVNDKIETENLTPIFFRTSLYLLATLFEKITNFTVKDILISLLQQDIAQIREIHIKNPNQYRTSSLADILQSVLQGNKSQVEVLFTLSILSKVQSHNTCDLKKRLQFYNKYFCTLIKLLMFNKKAMNNSHNIKLGLMVSILKPLTEEENEFRNTTLSKLRMLFSQSLEILYINICKEFQNENALMLVAFIDEKYEIFMNSKQCLNSFLSYAGFLIEKVHNNKINSFKVALNYLFHVRYLCLQLKGQKENILPIIRTKEIIGKILSTNECISCTKLIYSNVYINNHFIKLTNRQLLILQSTEKEPETDGIVVFNSYYKDIIWAKQSNNTLSIYESYWNIEEDATKYIKPFCIQLKLNSFEELNFVVDFLTEAKLKQIQTIKRKLEDFLHFSFV